MLVQWKPLYNLYVKISRIPFRVYIYNVDIIDTCKINQFHFTRCKIMKEALLL